MSVRTLDLYIGRHFLGTLLLMMLGAAIIIFLADYLEVLRRFSYEEGFTGLLGLGMAAMRVPILLDTALPFAFLFSALISLLSLSRRLELVVARASGVSAWGFLSAPILIAILAGGLATTVLNPVAVALYQRAESVEAELKGRSPWRAGHWLREEGPWGATVMHVGSASEDGQTLFGVTAFVFDPAGTFAQKIAAPRATFAGDEWRLADASIVSAASARHTVEEHRFPASLTPAELRRTFIDPDAVSVWSLPEFIATAERTGSDANRLQVAFHILLNRPLLFVAMVLIAATVSLRLTRFGGTWRLVLTGAAIAFLLYAATEIVNDIGANGIIDPIMAAWMPPVVALILGVTVLLYQEDG